MSQNKGKPQANGKSWEKTLREPEPQPERWISIAGEHAPNRGSKQVQVEKLTGVDPAAVEWLAEGRAPQGALCVVAGEMGSCKSLLAAEWAARLSNGRGRRDAALFAIAADMPGPFLRARLDAAGATVERIATATLSWPQPGDDVSLVQLERRVAALASGIQTGDDARLLVVDNLEAWAGGLDATPCRARINYLLVKLSELAVKTKTAIVVLARLNGPAGGRVAARELAELSAVAPVVWLTANDADEPVRRLLLPIKNSLGPTAPAAAFRIEAGRVAWEQDPVDLSAATIAPPTARSAAEQQDREEAAEWLVSALEDGPIESAELFRQARSCGISAKTLRRAAKNLGLKPRKSEFEGPWVWGDIRNSECGSRNGEASGAEESERAARNSKCGAEELMAAAG